MRRLLVSLLTVIVFSLPAAGQNNPYAIDDTCYEYFRMAERLVSDTSNDAFEYANNALLQRAEEVRDEKARTLFYIEKLRRTIRKARLLADREEANLMVELQKKEVTSVASATGYMQYFYHAYVLCQTYYMNTQQEIHAQALLQEMMEIATRNGDQYGIWQSHNYIAVLYQRQNDLLNARRHLLRLVDVFENSDDETLRRQSITRQYCDLADTYASGSDSARVFYARAEEGSKTHQDTLRVYYYKAQLAALDRNPDMYRRYRDLCLGDQEFPLLMLSGDRLFSSIDALMDKAPRDSVIVRAAGLASRQQRIFFRNFAITSGREDVAAWMGSTIIATFYSDISLLNNMKMEELSTAVQHRQLIVSLEQHQRLNRLLWIALGVLGAALVGALIALFLANNKNHHRQ